MNFFSRLVAYLRGRSAYDIKMHWEEQSKKSGLRSVMFWCEEYNRLADAVEKKELLRRLGNIESKCVLDLGCGIGRISKFLAERGAKVTGIDLPPMIERAKRENAHQGVTYVVGDVFGFDFPPSSFDYVVSIAVLPLVAKTDEGFKLILRQASKVLRGGGLFLSIDPFHQHLFRRPWKGSVAKAITIAEFFGLELVWRGGILCLPARVLIETLQKVPLLDSISARPVFDLGELILKFPGCQHALSDYKVLVFQKEVRK